jgi:hypothetical protein
MHKSSSRKSSKKKASSEREKAIALHAKAKREAEKRRKKGELVYYMLNVVSWKMMCLLIKSYGGMYCKLLSNATRG